VSSVLYMGLGGQAMGAALGDLLFGTASPSGKLAETWPASLDHVPSQPHFASDPRQIVYREALNVGYRYFATSETPPLFAFGHGLSFSSFSYSPLSLGVNEGRWLTTSSGKPADMLHVKLRVTNIGAVASSEVIQLYVRDTHASVHRPDRELRAFHKVHLSAGASEEVHFELGARAFAFYDTAAADWYVEPGTFEILVGAASDDIRQLAVHEVSGSPRSAVGGALAPKGYKQLDDAGLAQMGLVVPPPPPPRPYGANTTLQEASESGWIAWLIFHIVLRVAKFGARLSGASAGVGDAETTVAIVDGGLRCMTFRSMQLMSGGALGDTLLGLILRFLNG